MQPLDHNKHGPKSGGAVPLLREAGSPSKTMSPVPRSYISTKWHPALIWPQQTWAENQEWESYASLRAVPI